MSITAEKIAAEALALPDDERAFLARELIVSLDLETNPDAEAEWSKVIDRRSREISEGKVQCRPVEETVQKIRARLHASRRQPS
jgi:putative addiction module component (TIGR02574 family)